MINQDSALEDLMQSKKLSEIVENLNYFADSVLNIDDLNEKFPLLYQFLKHEGKLRKIPKSHQHNNQNIEKAQTSTTDAILTLLDNCFNCTF